MHTQLAVFCVLAVSMVLANGGADSSDSSDGGDCSSGPCRRHLGVYYLAESITPNVTSYQVATLHADGTFNAIDSLADGTDFPPSSPFGSFSNNDGVWTCDGRDSIKVNSLFFLYPTSQSPRSLARGEYKLNFGQNGLVTGKAYFTVYDLKSTTNPNQSQWTKLLGPIEYSVTGYKLFNTCSS